MSKLIKTQKKSIMETEAIIQVSKVKRMSAKESYKLALQKWSVLPTEKIFEKIYTQASEGYRNAYFGEAYINGEQYLMLEELGYKVKIGTSELEHPFFAVSW